MHGTLTRNEADGRDLDVAIAARDQALLDAEDRVHMLRSVALLAQAAQDSTVPHTGRAEEMREAIANAADLIVELSAAALSAFDRHQAAARSARQAGGR